MLKEEWLKIGYEKGLIDEVNKSEWVSFETVYRAWFQTKLNRIRPQSVDRIEVTYNRYYADTDFSRLPVHSINEQVLYTFLNSILIKNGSVTQKEYARIYQIANNVMQYGFDICMGRCYCVNWNVVKRYIALENIKSVEYKELCVSAEDRNTIAKAVLCGNIYPAKRSACLCLLLNFYLGLRIGELAGLTWENVNFEGGYIYINSTEVKAFSRDALGKRLGSVEYKVQDRTKTLHSVRTVPLVNESRYLLQLLKNWHIEKDYNSPYLAYDGTDTILSKSLERTLRRLCQLCDVPQFSSHRIRKTFATELHKNGVPTKVISDLMGHSEMRTTERNYIISSPDTIDMVRDAMCRVPIIVLPESISA